MEVCYTMNLAWYTRANAIKITLSSYPTDIQTFNTIKPVNSGEEFF